MGRKVRRFDGKFRWEEKSVVSMGSFDGKKSPSFRWEEKIIVSMGRKVSRFDGKFRWEEKFIVSMGSFDGKKSPSFLNKIYISSSDLFRTLVLLK